jgi:hypothetical protein
MADDAPTGRAVGERRVSHQLNVQGASAAHLFDTVWSFIDDLFTAFNPAPTPLVLLPESKALIKEGASLSMTTKRSMHFLPF